MMTPIDLPSEETLTFVLPQLTRPRMRILDIGCGNGVIASRLQAHGHSVVAIDEDPDSVESAAALGIDARVAAWPEFEDDPFDAILFLASLHHIFPLDNAVSRALRLLHPSGLVIVEEFAWGGVDLTTAEWFYSIVRLLVCASLLSSEGDSFVAELARSNGEMTVWQQSHDHDLHTVPFMWSALEAHFHERATTNAPYLYRYVCSALPQDELGYTIASQVLDSERRLAKLGAITLIGHRFVGRKAKHDAV